MGDFPTTAWGMNLVGAAKILCSFLILSLSSCFLPGPSRRHQQRDCTVAPAGHCRSISLHQRPAAVPYPQCRLPASLLSPALPTHLPSVARSLLPRQRPLQPEPPARPATTAAPGLARPEAEPGVWALAHAPGVTPPAVGPGPSQGLPAARGPPARPTRARFRARGPPDPLLTSRHRGRPGKRRCCGPRGGNAALGSPALPEASWSPGLRGLGFPQ